MRLLWFNLATDIDDPLLGFTTRWIEAVAEQVDFIHVVTMRAGKVKVPNNVRVHSVGQEKGYSKLRRVWEFYRILLRILRKDKIDACFSHMIPIFTVLAAPPLKANSIPIVTWYAHPSLSTTLKIAHRLSSKVVTTMPSSYPYRHDVKVVPIGQGIDTDLFSPDEQVKLQNQPMILCVGRLSPVKDHITLIRAASLLRKSLNTPFKVVILGNPTGPNDERYVQKLRREVNLLGLEDVVVFHPAVPMIELPDWYRRCTVHVNLTPVGFGDKVALEAMACGKPCLVANKGFRKTLGKYADSLLFDHGDANSLAARLEQMLQMEERERAVLDTYLRARVVQMHGLHGLASRLVNLLSSHSRRKGVWERSTR